MRTLLRPPARRHCWCNRLITAVTYSSTTGVPEMLQVIAFEFRTQSRLQTELFRIESASGAPVNFSWFKPWGWIYRPIAWQAWILAIITGSFCVQVFLAVDRHSHSASDTLYGVFPVFCACIWDFRLDSVTYLLKGVSDPESDCCRNIAISPVIRL